MTIDWIFIFTFYESIFWVAVLLGLLAAFFRIIIFFLKGK